MHKDYTGRKLMLRLFILPGYCQFRPLALGFGFIAPTRRAIAFARKDLSLPGSKSPG